MKTITGIEYNLINNSNIDALIYQVTIRGETKEVTFNKNPVDGSYYSPKDVVYVSIQETENYYANKVRKSYLKLGPDLNLLDIYTILNHHALIVCWKDSELGISFRGLESFDGQHPVPIGVLKMNS